MTRAQAQPFQRSSDGRWIGRLPRPDGTVQHVTGTDRDDVLRRMELARRSIASSPPADGYLRDAIERWFAETAPVRYRPKTTSNNLSQARLHILPVLGDRIISTLVPSDVQRMADRMTAQGYAAQSVANVVHILSVVLEVATADGIIARNPCRHVRLPKRDVAPLPSMTIEEVGRFLELTREETLWPAWALAFATGIRAGELCGLRWSDWDREARTLTVDGQWHRVRDGRRVGYIRQPGKTRNARRLLHLPDLATEALTVQLAQAHSAVDVFTTTDGRPYHPTWLSHRFAATLAAHRLRHVRLHSLRHTAAMTMLDASGGDIVAVSKVLGHSTIAITVDTYSREADAARQRGAGYMDAAMKRRVK
jgi:integrase